MGLNFMDPENAADVVEAIKEYVDSHGGGSVSPVATWTAATIEASDWDENVYSFETTYPSSRYDIQGVQLAENATDAQRTAFKAMDSGGYTSTNIIIAHGTVPSIDIPVMLGVIDKQAVPQDGSQWISYQDYQALTEQEKMDGTAYFVYNWPDSGVTVKGKVFVGTRAEWNALSSSEKATYDKSLGGIVNLTDDESVSGGSKFEYICELKNGDTSPSISDIKTMGYDAIMISAHKYTSKLFTYASCINPLGIYQDNMNMRIFLFSPGKNIFVDWESNIWVIPDSTGLKGFTVSLYGIKF